MIELDRKFGRNATAVVVVAAAGLEFGRRLGVAVDGAALLMVGQQLAAADAAAVGFGGVEVAAAGAVAAASADDQTVVSDAAVHQSDNSYRRGGTNLGRQEFGGLCCSRSFEMFEGEVRGRNRAQKSDSRRLRLRLAVGILQQGVGCIPHQSAAGAKRG